MTPPPSLQELIQTVRQDSPSESPLDLLVTASQTVSQLEETGDAVLDHFVAGCRRDGKSWSEISAALGVSKQAVHKRFSGAIADQIIASTTPTLDRFTERARTVLTAARASARDLGSPQVRPGHLLVALFSQPEGIAARVLTGMGVTAQAATAALGASITGDAPPANDPKHPPFAPECERVLRDTLAVALELGHNYIGTEHMLLGLLREEDTPVAGALAGLGVGAAGVKVRIGELLRGFTRPATPPPGQ
jgi:hypothetical protein